MSRASRVGNDEFSTKHDEFSTKNDELSIKKRLVRRAFLRRRWHYSVVLEGAESVSAGGAHIDRSGIENDELLH